jgi:hypothetical protein
VSQAIVEYKKALRSATQDDVQFNSLSGQWETIDDACYLHFVELVTDTVCIMPADLRTILLAWKHHCVITFLDTQHAVVMFHTRELCTEALTSLTKRSFAYAEDEVIPHQACIRPSLAKYRRKGEEIDAKTKTVGDAWDSEPEGEVDDVPDNWEDVASTTTATTTTASAPKRANIRSAFVIEDDNQWTLLSVDSDSESEEATA